jgi:hypothetical protein
MTNSDNGGSLAQEILFAIAAEYKWPDFGPREIAPIAVDSTALKSMVGSYAADTPFKVRATVTFEGGKLFLAEPQFIPRSEVLFLSPDKAIALETGMEFSFGTDAKGKVDRIEIPGVSPLKRVK